MGLLVYAEQHPVLATIAGVVCAVLAGVCFFVSFLFSLGEDPAGPFNDEVDEGIDTSRLLKKIFFIIGCILAVCPFVLMANGSS